MAKYYSVLTLIIFLFLPHLTFSQSGGLKITSPTQEVSTVSTSTLYFRGTANPKSTLLMGQDTIKIYSTGVFAAEIKLKEGKNEFAINYKNGDQVSQKNFVVHYTPPNQPEATAGFAIEYVRVLPGGDMWLQEGDLLQVEMKASPGMKASFFKNIPMTELPAHIAGVAGIYRGEYLIRSEDIANRQKINFFLFDQNNKKQIEKNSEQYITFHAKQPSIIALTNKSGVELSYGLGADRLGGAKMGSLDNQVRLHITGKMQRMYRVKLSDQMQAYVHENDVDLLEGTHFIPESLTSSWSITSDENYDYVAINLGERLPYISKMEENPTRLIVDIYGATSNSNWITQKEGLKAIKNVWYEQISKDVFRAFIELKAPEHWGHQISYRNNTLLIRIKPRPQNLNIKNLTIAIDAGHGGSNSGAVGMTGVIEKDLNLIMAQKVRELLEKKGSTVVMTRSTDRYISNGQRVQNLREIDPDLLISIHCNASVNPMVQGSSTYYRHQAFRPLSDFLYKEILKLEMADFGNVGGFNFVLNAPTEFPSALVEVAFMSNPADEEKLLNPDFQSDIANSIVNGIENFIKYKNNN